MRPIELSYALKSGFENKGLIRNALMDLLQSVRNAGSISAAAKGLNLSYRHVWGELKRWESELGQTLIIWDKGQKARLSPFGDKLLWAERQAQARLAPQIEALHADLERAIALAFDDNTQVLPFHASHDDALAMLRKFCAQSTPPLHLDIQFTGSVDAIRALNQGRCTMAGFHTLVQPALGTLAQKTYKPLLKPGLHKVIGFASRWQGLIVSTGNPLKIKTLADAKNHRFVNRESGTGTRVVLDELMNMQGLHPNDFVGYDRTEPSHAAVAHAVASGQADVGLGLGNAAQALGLEFVPLVQEHYHLVCLKTTLNTPATQALLAVLQLPYWQSALNAMPGYCAQDSGQVQSLKQILPWWNFKQEKTVSVI
ncbi:MAG: helix-turn-helix transcriptional regulator [Betaproteobacteria bacterium]|jgi:putative molybdopterin biosynthesis protein|nr:helix-turn-helix transcriptional regulator [Betaproteobacteria bacterium]